MEYPGYGIYEGNEPSETSILEDAETVFRYLTEEMKIKKRKIIVAGRSLGSGPASFITEKYSPGAMILISPFTSIKAVAKNLFGFFAKMLIKERFNNLERIKKIKSPTLIIHGKADKTIPSQHSEDLYGKRIIFIL